MTFAEFVELVNQTKISDAQIWIEEWKKQQGKEWDIHKDFPLEKNLVVAFAIGIARIIQARIMSISTCALYNSTIESGHAFLQEIHQKATEHGIELELKEIDVPLSTTEAMVQSGHITTDEKGAVALTDKGKQAAQEISDQISGKKV